jgi:PIN domain nuclease of toxin-antitoxin system
VRVLLGTHALLWWLVDDPKLSVRARECIASPGNTVFVSSASAWEIATKHRLGKLPEAQEAAEKLPALVRRARFTPLPITIEHAHRAGGLRAVHRDPFDRMLAAQASLEELPTVTPDSAFQLFRVETLW